MRYGNADMNTTMKKLAILIIPTLLLLQCSLFIIRNPKLTYSLALVKENIDVSKNKTTLKTPPGEIVIYDQDSVKIFMQLLTPIEIAQYVINMNEYRGFPDNTRIPPLTFIKFRVVNNSANTKSLNFLSSFFTDSTGFTYNTLSEKEYKTSYTSASYKVFTYSNMFSLFITKKTNKVHPKKMYYEKFEPGKSYEVKKDEEVTQIVGYRYFSSTERDYNFTCFLGELQISSPMRLLITRSDQEE